MRKKNTNTTTTTKIVTVKTITARNIGTIQTKIEAMHKRCGQEFVSEILAEIIESLDTAKKVQGRFDKLYPRHEIEIEVEVKPKRKAKK